MLATSVSYGQALEEITVTARKTAENLQEVPLSITAIGSEQIDRLGIKDLADLSQQDTSVQFDEGFTPSDTRITIRGLSPTRGRPNAATLLDGIDITSEAVSNAGGSLLIDPALIDVERIEIVKGPQSALFGRSAFAGAVQYVTKDPADVLSGGIFLDYNVEGDEELRGNISIPVSDTFGIRLNGRVWNSDGYYENVATGKKIGGGKGTGGTITLKWEPTDTFSAKWRTDYSDDQFDIAAQVLLNDRNTLFDLGTSGGLDPMVSGLAPNSGLRLPTAAEITAGIAVDRAGCVDTIAGGFLDNYDCGDGAVLDDFLRNPTQDPNFSLPQPGSQQGSGLYDESDDWGRNVYNKQVTSVYVGKFPDAKHLQPSISPDYRLVSDPFKAKDFTGTDRIVFRNSLVLNWDMSDTLAFSSYTSFTDASEDTATDIGKYFIDNCRPDPTDMRAPQFVAQSMCDRGDGLLDTGITFFQDSFGDTQQLSQEFRLAWDVTDSLKFTQGLQYWRERVESVQLNNSTVGSGPVCYLALFGTTNDIATHPFAAGFFDQTPEQFQCGNSSASGAYWADDTYAARTPSTLNRSTNHYSWYGQLQWNVTDSFRATLEGRYTREDNEVNGPTQYRCLEGLSAEFLANPDDTKNGIPSDFRDSANGRPLCEGWTVTDTGDYRNVTGSESAATTGPGTAIICGQVGRCENLDLAPGGSWGDYGFGNQFGYTQKLNRKDRYWAPKLTLEYFWNEDIMTYFSWSRGIKPGGFSLLTLGAFGLDANNDGIYDEVEFDSERLDVWELGAKTTLLDGRMRLNGAAFFQDFKDKQVTVQTVVGQNVGTKVDNISGSEVKGFELDVTFQATDNLLVSAGYTFLKSEYTDYTVRTRSGNDITRAQLGSGTGCTEIVRFPDDEGDRFCVASLNGNELERVPRNAFLLNATYTANLFDTGLEWYGEVNYRYQDSRWLEQWNIVEFPAYSLTTLSAGILADTWDVQLYLQNAFDDDTVISGGANPGIPTGSFGFGFESVNGLVPPGINAGPKLPSDAYANMPNPRILGVRVNLRFGE
jgi:outer membrane receptor protein involved in Fe transport